MIGLEAFLNVLYQSNTQIQCENSDDTQKLGMQNSNDSQIPSPAPHLSASQTSLHLCL